jgi:hypothetical protein
MTPAPRDTSSRPMPGNAFSKQTGVPIAGSAGSRTGPTSFPGVRS